MSLLFAFFLDKTQTERYGVPVITIKEHKSSPHHLIIDKEKKAHYCSNPLLNSLFCQEEWWKDQEAKKDFSLKNKPFSFFRLQGSLAMQTLKSLCGTSQFFVLDKQITANFFSKLTLEYHVTTSDNNQFSVKGILKNSTTSVPITSASLLLKSVPCGILTDNFLHFIHEDISWNEILWLKNHVDTHLSKEEYLRWKKDLDLDPNFSILVENVQNLQTKHIPIPVLRLSDHTGSFCNLFMEYEGHVPVRFLDKTNDFFRDIESEKVFEKDLIEIGFQKKSIGSSDYYCPVDKAVVALDFLLEIGWKIYDENKKKLLRLHDIDCSLKESNNRLEFEGRVNFSKTSIDIAPFFQSMKQNKRFLSLSDDSIGLLNIPKNSTLPMLLKEIEFIQDRASLKKNRIGLIDSDFIPAEKITLEMKPSDIEALGERFCGTLWPHQTEGLQFLQKLYHDGSNGFLADDMGLGKTIQVLAFLSTLPRDIKSLIVVPTSLIFNWHNEIKRFYKDASIHLYIGNNRTLEQSTITLTSHATFRLDVAHFEEHHFDIVIVDEAQSMKNKESLLFQSFQKLKPSFRLLLTGTPIENSLSELWTYFHFLDPDLLGTWQNFQQQKDFPHFHEVMRKKIRPFFLRRKKEDVAKNLPEKIEQTIYIELNDRQKDLYVQFLSSFQKGLVEKIKTDGLEKHRMEIFEAILRLRQLVLHPLLVGQLSDDASIPSSKFEAVLSDLEQLVESGKKVVIFSQFTQMLQLFIKEMKNRGIPTLLLDGSTRNREEVVTKFQEDPKEQLFFISLKAGGVGLNLTRADYIIIYDPWWNSAQESQAIARAHRIGRTDTVFCRKYIAKDTIEEKILLLQAKKEAISASIFDSQDTPGNLISLDDLEELLN